MDGQSRASTRTGLTPVFENLDRSPSDGVPVVLASGEEGVGDVSEPDVEFVAAETLVEVLHRETDRLVVVLGRPAKVDRGEGGIPGRPKR